MSNKEYILDPLWITKGSYGPDYEYLNYILLSANKKWKDRLNDGDTSSFFEILFHILNLNTLAVHGNIYDSKMNLVWDNETITNIRNRIRQILKQPDELIDIFRNSNKILVSAIKDHLEVLLSTLQDIDIYYTNKNIHREKEIFILTNYDTNSYEMWRLNFDKRLKLNWELNKVKNFNVPNLKDNIVGDTIRKFNDPILNRMDEDHNLILCIPHEEMNPKLLTDSIAFTILFSRMVINEVDFKPNILFELQDVLNSEKILPFIFKDWI